LNHYKRFRSKTQISRENGHKRPAPVTDSAISNTSEEDEELGEDLGGLDTSFALNVLLAIRKGEQE